MSERRTCPACGSDFTVYPSQIKRGEGTYCSRPCGNPARGRSGPANGNWRGGRFVRSDGYVAVWVSGRGYILEHPLVVERRIGRILRPGETVHHRDGNRSNNRDDNLELTTPSAHTSDYHPPQKDPTKWVQVSCLSCGRVFERRRNETIRHPYSFCCRTCYKQGAAST